jgi:lipoprotein-anchoring transpeptidase ErfK/SrfK
MSLGIFRRILFPLLALASARGQAVLTGVEPGLQDAVRWKWQVTTSPESDWGLDVPEPPPAPEAATAPAAPAPAEAFHEVRKGDALILIAKKSGRTVAQLRAANGLKSDTIRVGDILRIPTIDECIALGLPPEPPRPAQPAKQSNQPGAPAGVDWETLLVQVFLDRENFSFGPIDARPGAGFQKLAYLYQMYRGGSASDDARAAVRNITASYRLRPSDFRFIAPPKAEIKSPEPPPAGKSPKKPPKPTDHAKEPPAPVYGEMTSSPMLAYRSPWEFVAERFHCDEKLLRALNPTVRPVPPADTEFVVPNVVPFEIEKAFVPPIQPVLGPGHVVTAVIVDISRIEIFLNDRLVAIFPVASARPGLRGRGMWRVLDAIPRPRLVTLREPRDPPKPVSTFYTGESAPAKPEVLDAPEYLPAGPNNPAGIIWINLAKTDPPEILPYGLHGTSVPARMSTLSGIGGFRMPNWDIARAVRLLPSGTPLFWKQSATPPAAPAAPATPATPPNPA